MPSPRLTRLAAPALACLALAACAPEAGEGDGAAQDAAARDAATAFAADKPAAAVPSAGGGAFRVAYDEPESSLYAQWQAFYREDRFLEDVAEWLNGWVALPEDVWLTFGECGEPNAFYEPEERAVILCYELVEDLDHIFAEEEDAEQGVADALLFTLLHEVGHALVHVLELPVTGKEEDAVDQLAALVLVEGAEGGDEAAVNGAVGLPDDGEQLDELAYADEHALSAQRFYNVLCLVYGQNPDAYAAWVDDGTLPPERAERCPGEYAQVSAAWERLLGPYLKG